MTSVTVYIPAYNVAKFLARAIESLRAQTYGADEIIVIDDGSQDETVEIARRFPQVKVIRHDANRGLGAARNTAVRTARNEFVASLDADCVAEPEWLAALVAALADPKVAGVGGKLTEGVQVNLADRWRRAHMPQEWGDSFVRNPKFLFGCNSLFRKSLVLEAGGYDERMRTNGEDTDLSARLRARGWDLLYTPVARATHLRHDSAGSILDTYWRWWRFGVNAYANGPRLRSVLGHAIFVHFRYNFLGPLRKDIEARRWELVPFDFLILAYFPYRDFRLWLNAKKGSANR
ncbi:MAG: glycosyltransferase family 2 protein [Candidatus Acidiferrum sp.]